MISTRVVSEIQRMLQEGRLSQRKIARHLGVSRGTVNAIAVGKRAATCDRQGPDGGGFVPPHGRVKRCPGCGGMVQMPCLLCFIRNRPTDKRWNRERGHVPAPSPG